MVKTAIALAKTRRVPKRSISHPTARQPNAVVHVLTNSADDSSPRLTPSPSLTGFRKTPKVKMRIEPCPTIKPQAEATTTHHLFAQSPVIFSS